MTAGATVAWQRQEAARQREHLVQLGKTTKQERFEEAERARLSDPERDGRPWYCGTSVRYMDLSDGTRSDRQQRVPGSCGFRPVSRKGMLCKKCRAEQAKAEQRAEAARNAARVRDLIPQMRVARDPIRYRTLEAGLERLRADLDAELDAVCRILEAVPGGLHKLAFLGSAETGPLVAVELPAGEVRALAMLVLAAAAESRREAMRRGR